VFNAIDDNEETGNSGRWNIYMIRLKKDSFT
jgi:hypothetical protein